MSNLYLQYLGGAEILFYKKKNISTFILCQKPDIEVGESSEVIGRVIQKSTLFLSKNISTFILGHQPDIEVVDSSEMLRRVSKKALFFSPQIFLHLFSFPTCVVFFLFYFYFFLNFVR